VLREQLDVVEGRARGREAGRGLDEVGARGGDDAAHLDLLLVGQQAGLDDDLEDAALAGGLDGSDLVFELVPLPVLDPAEIDDHVDLVRAVGDGVGGLEALDGGRRIAVREADDGADGHFVAQIVLRLAHVGGRDADGRGLIGHGVVADGFDFAPRRGLGEQRVVNLAENFFHVHG